MRKLLLLVVTVFLINCIRGADFYPCNDKQIVFIKQTAMSQTHKKFHYTMTKMDYAWQEVEVYKIYQTSNPRGSYIWACRTSGLQQNLELIRYNEKIELFFKEVEGSNE